MNLHTYYGLVHILQGVNLYVNEGEVVSVLGRNGAGKTTTIKSIMGIAPPSEGKILLKGKDISGLEPHEVAQNGISYVPASRGIFSSLTAYEKSLNGDNATMIISPNSEFFDYLNSDSLNE